MTHSKQCRSRSCSSLGVNRPLSQNKWILWANIELNVNNVFNRWLFVETKEAAKKLASLFFEIKMEKSNGKKHGWYYLKHTFGRR